MKHTTKKPEDDQAIITITATAADIKPHLTASLKEFAKELTLPGFRKGKVPLAKVQENVDENLLQNDVLQQAINAMTFKVMQDEDLQPLDPPKVDIKKFVPFDTLDFEATISILPPVDLADYSKIKKKIEEPKVEQAEVDKVLENIKLQNSTKKPVDRKAKEGDEAWIDFSGVDKDGKSIEGAKGENYPLSLGSNTFIPGFEDAVMGLKKDDTKTFDTTFPKDYRVKTLAGTKVTFTVIVKEVKEVELPEVNDELAAEIGPFKTATELEAAINQELFAQNSQKNIDKVKQEIVDEIIKTSKIPTPESLVKDQTSMLRQDLQANLDKQGMTLEMFAQNQGKSMEELDKQIADDAIRRVKSGLVISQIAKDEDITVSKEELETQLSMMAENNPNPQFGAELQKPAVQRDFHSRMVTQKTLNFLLEKTTK